MNLLLEQMIPLRHPVFKIRVWRQCELPASNHDLPPETCDLVGIVNDMKGVEHSLTIAKEIIGMPSVNAVEVVDGYGHGVVLYRDWP